MAKDTYTPLLSEVLKKVHNAKTKDKKLHQVYKGLSENVVKEAFGWTDNFTRS